MITTDSLSTFGIIATSRILVVMPHPDDEAIFCGGLIHKLTTEHISVRIITMTLGEQSTLRWGLKAGEKLATVRKKELLRALRILGVTDSQIYRYADGTLEKLEKPIQKTVCTNIRSFHPTHVVTLEPDGIYGHPDHVALSAYVTGVVHKPVQLLYVTVSPNYHLPKAVWMAKKKQIKPLNPDFKLKLELADIITKIKSLHAHRSQFDSLIWKLPFFLKNKLLSCEFFAWGN